MLFDYLVAGLPVLASNIRTHTQYVRHGENGMIFEYDSHSVARTIRDLSERRSDIPDLKRRAYASGQPYLWDAIEPEFVKTIAALEKRGCA